MGQIHGFAQEKHSNELIAIKVVQGDFFWCLDIETASLKLGNNYLPRWIGYFPVRKAERDGVHKAWV